VTQTRRLPAVLQTSLARNSGLIGADGQEAPLAKLPAVYVIALSVVVLLAFAGAAWLAWFVSRGLTLAYIEGFRSVRLPEE
jgi:hypothetical protein